MNTVQEILERAGQTLCALAAEVGVDGEALMAALPEPGYLMKGASVPVIAPNYKNTCSVLMFINTTKEGFTWPLVRFHTFKYGGIERTFNGLDWLRSHPDINLLSGSKRVKACDNSFKQTGGFRRANVKVDRPMKAEVRLANDKEDEKRRQRYESLVKQYTHAKPLNANHSWVVKRLQGHATDSLLSRLDVRMCNGGRILAPLLNANINDVGFHQVRTVSDGDEKRHFIRQSGLLKGSYIKIAPAYNDASVPVALCEGLATGLSVALIWPGEVRVALTAGNLKPVREGVTGRVVLFSDDDVWKPEVGNTGRQAAIKALKEGDGLCLPLFNEQSKRHKPTDFNDLLMLEGIEALSEQTFAML